jgi:transcriptional regulator with XRE-family HTH domain
MSDMTHESLPAILRVLRARQGLTLIEAARKIGIGRDTLSDLERGNRHPVMPTLAKIAQGYGVPVEELLEEPTLTGPKAPAPSASGQPSEAGEEALEAFEREHYSPVAIAAGWHRLAQRWDERLKRSDVDAHDLEELIDTLEDLAVGMEANIAEERRELAARYDDAEVVRNMAVLVPAIRRLSALVGEGLRKIDAEHAAEMSPKVARLNDHLKRAG